MKPHDPQINLKQDSVRILLLGGSDSEAREIRSLLGNSRTLSIALHYAKELSEVDGRLEPKQVSLVLAFDEAANPVDRVADIFNESPVVVLGGEEDEVRNLEVLQLGARAFIAKRRLTTPFLINTLTAALASHRTIYELREAREHEQHLGTHDQLTGLANRYLFHDLLAKAAASARRSNQKLALLFMDLDRFKLVNDTLGHGVGDSLLRSVADHLRKVLRESDTAARLGGDEFAVLLTGLRDELDASRIATKILETLRQPIVLKSSSILCTASIGIATLPRDGDNPKELIKKADTAMYHAKNRGRNRFEFFTQDMNAATIRRILLETGLKTAIARQELALFYQPIFDLRLERIVGAEALIRWRHPDLGFLGPAEFLGLAEETGAIVPVGEWVLRTACKQNLEWQRLGDGGFRISVNVSPRQLQEPNFAETVEAVLTQTGMPASLLEIEITESSIVQNANITINTLHSLKKLGVRLSIDDFGTGYSALSYLKHLPIDALKIDQSFVRSLNSDPADATIIRAIVMMAKGLNLSTVVEGVETHEQLLLLASYGCNRMQGYLFGKPAIPEIFERKVLNPDFKWNRD